MSHLPEVFTQDYIIYPIECLCDGSLKNVFEIKQNIVLMLLP